MSRTAGGMTLNLSIVVVDDGREVRTAVDLDMHTPEISSGVRPETCFMGGRRELRESRLESGNARPLCGPVASAGPCHP